jgi:outer membrane biosynthesis protein TonB
MKIVCEFENLAEVEDFLCGVLIAPNLVKAAREEALAPKAAEPKKEEPKPEAPKAKKAEAPKQEASKQEAQPIAEETPSATKTEESTEPVAEKVLSASGHTESDLKLLLSDKLKQGKRAAIKELFDKHEVECLTDLLKKEKDSIDAVYAEAEVL